LRASGQYAGERKLEAGEEQRRHDGLLLESNWWQELRCVATIDRDGVSIRIDQPVFLDSNPFVQIALQPLVARSRAG